jgi:hypothetical protein
MTLRPDRIWSVYVFNNNCFLFFFEIYVFILLLKENIKINVTPFRFVRFRSVFMLVPVSHCNQ